MNEKHVNMELQTVVFEDTNGITWRHHVDPDGVIISKQKLEQRWVEDNQSVLIYDTDKEEEYGEEKSLGRNPQHIKLYRTNIQHILSRLDLSKDARCAFLSCVAYLDWNSNYVVDPVTKEPLSGREIAERTGLNKNVMNVGLQELNAHGIVAVMSSGRGRAQHYVVNPSVAWKGKRVAKDMSQVKHFKKNGLDLPVDVKYSPGIKEKE